MTSHANDAPDAKPGAADELVEIFKTVGYALLIALALRVLLFQPFTIPSASMEPNLYEGDYIIVSKYSYGWSRHSIPFSPPILSGRLFFHAPTRGDIIVFKLPRDNKTDYIKRLIGLPGDRVQVKAGAVYVNGQPLTRTPLGPAMGDLPDGYTQVARYQEQVPAGRSHVIQSGGNDGPVENTGVYVVPPHCYFMMGDNRDNSLDSRFDPAIIPGEGGATGCPWDPSVDIPGSDGGVGFVPEENLEGRAQIILLSWKPGASLFKPWTWILDARPSRFFKILK